MSDVDTRIDARWIIPVNREHQVLENHSLVIHDGKILDILAHDEARMHYSARTVHDLTRHALIPGLVNAHTHAAMSLFRGLADDLPLMEWLEKHIWPAESQWVNEEFVEDGTELAIAEMLRSGTTCFNDMYFFPDVTARIISNAGMRACVGLIVLDFPTIWASNADEYIDKGLALRDEYRSDPLINFALAPHAPYTVSDAPLKKIRTLAFELDIPVHMHIHETAFEVEQAMKSDNKRPLQRLHDMGLVAPDLIGVHMTQLNEDEIEQLATAGSHVVHCPQSNMKLASGFCPVADLVESGVNVAIGTDGCASNNDLDMLSEMQSAAFLAKGVAADPTAVPAHQALEMATINGARALGLDKKIGSLEIGKSADVTAIQLNQLETTPLFEPVSQIVYSCTRESVSDVWVAGQQLLRERVLTTLNESSIIQKALAWQQKIQASDAATDEQNAKS